MSVDEAELQYVRVVSDLLPEWNDPQPPDAALLVSCRPVELCRRRESLTAETEQRTWTPDDDSDECSACGEVFTFLNRRHHVRL